MKLALLPDVLTNAVVLAALYSLIGLAWVFLFRTTRILNFATGELLLLGAFVYFSLVDGFGLPAWAALLITIAITGVLGNGLHRVVMSHLTGQPEFSGIIVTIGLAAVLSSVMAMTWGTRTRQIPPPYTSVTYEYPGGVFLTTHGFVTVGLAALLFTLVLLVLRYSAWGVQMRAAAEHPLLASQGGINVESMYAASWAVAAAVAAVAGIVFAMTNVLNFGMVPLGLRGIAPALLGGLDSVKGVAIGGLVVAVVESLSVLYFGAEVRNVAAFGVLLLVLMLKPNGLFGTREVRRV